MPSFSYALPTRQESDSNHFELYLAQLFLEAFGQLPGTSGNRKTEFSDDNCDKKTRVEH